MCGEVEPARVTIKHGGHRVSGTAIAECDLHHAECIEP